MKVLNQNDLSKLTTKELTLVQQLLIEETDVFSGDDTDIGNITSTETEAKLSDQTPVQLNYHSLPRPLYAELKTHLEDLVNKGWIVHLTSSYSSPVASLR